MTRLPFAAAAAILASGAASAADFSFSGTFSQDDDVVIFDFMVGAPSTVTLRSFSYAGGTQADRTVVAAGGFDPIVAVFDAAGVLIGDQDDANDDGNVVPADPVTSDAFDVLLDLMLAAGSYSVAISQFENFAAGPNLSDGFDESGADFTSAFGCAAGRFCDFGGFDRAPSFAFDILNVASAAVGDGTTGGVETGGGGMSVIPLPAAGWLAMLALGGLGAMRRR